MPAISATIITYNEARTIARAIRSLGAADEILVVDSGSTDDTRAVAEGLGARVIENVWPGYAAQKRFAVAQARHNWILSLDADEEFDVDAQEAIRRWKPSEPGAAGYRFARRAFFLGRWILHSGWYPDHKIRLFDRRQGNWQGEFVHESVVVTGPVADLGGEILHYTCDSLEEFQDRIEVYTDLAAQEMILQGRGVGVLRRMLTPPLVFLATYFLRLGVLDGYQGYLIARTRARSVARKYSKWAALDAQRRRGAGKTPPGEKHSNV